ncbi:hypothetical protein ACFOLF_02490 [Paenibacillus sepulcri]
MKQYFAIMVLCLTVTAGCASSVEDRSPKELLALTVSGLSGVDHYTFKGTTNIATGDGMVIKPLSFQGTVKDHERLEVKSSDIGSSEDVIHPLELLKQIEDTASAAELVPAESGNTTAVLLVKTEEKAAAEKWTAKLRSEFKDLQNSMPLAAGSGIRQQSTKAETEASFQKEWQAEITRSGRLLEDMLSTLQVSSTYKLIVDKKRLLPLRLQEHTILRYKTQGEQRQESRISDITFQVLSDAKQK